MRLDGWERLRFTFHGSGIAHYPPGTSFGPRRLGDYEFVWITDGQVEWTPRPGVTIPAPAGTVVLGQPGMVDAFRWDPKRQTRHGFFHFLVHDEHSVLPPLTEWPLSRELPDQDILRPLFHHLGWLLARGEPVAREQAQGVMRQILTAYLTGFTATAVGDDSEEHPVIRQVFEHICEVWSDQDLAPITLGDLARAAGISKVHLTRVFQARFGMPPVEAVRLIRLDRAASLLSRTDLPVQEISRLTGFVNPFHFSRSFAATYACSPREYRRRVVAGEVTPAPPLVRARSLTSRVLYRLNLVHRA